MVSKLVILDAHTLNPGDLSWDAVRAFAQQTDIYERSTPIEVVERAKDAEIVLVNKVVLDRSILAQLPKLRYIVVLASGYNNIDLQATKELNITVSNGTGYSTMSVAQHVFAMLFAILNRVETHHASVQAGDWSASPDFMYSLQCIEGLEGKTMGIYGFGRIGQAVARIAQAFGMHIISTHKHPIRDARPNVRFVDLETLFRESDIVSLHAPLSPANTQIVNKDLLQLLQPTAYLINTGRGGLIHESDLKDALEAGTLAGAALDVLSAEPPAADHVLLGVRNCWITPHQAWASRQARTRLMHITAANIQSFLEGKPQNLVSV